MRTIASLRERVTIRALTVTVSTATGEQTEAWADSETSVPASIRPLTGRESLQAQALKASQTYEVAMRYRGWVTGKHRIVWGNKTLENTLPPADEDARQRFLVLQCTETS